MMLMDFSLRLLGSTNPVDALDKFKKLFSAGFWLYARTAIINTRSYLEGLGFVDRLADLNMFYWNLKVISDEEFKRHDRSLILFRLQLFDKLDWWKDYVEYFEQMRRERFYELTYVAERSEDQEFSSYVLRRDTTRKYVHFLYKQSHRYNLIKTKLAKMQDGKSVKNLYHKRQADLTCVEIERRFQHIMDCAEKGLPVFEPG